MHEQLFLNGAPVVGFGADDGCTGVEGEKKFYALMLGVPFLGCIAGAIGGAALGKGAIGTASGAVIGGLVGVAGGVGAAVLTARIMCPPEKKKKSAWRLIQPTDLVQAGQRIAVAAQVSPSDIADLNNELIQAGNKSSTIDPEAWPPGYTPPSDRWPTGDTMGAAAYRFAFNAPVSGGARDLTGMPRNTTAQIWVRDPR